MQDAGMAADEAPARYLLHYNQHEEFAAEECAVQLLSDRALPPSRSSLQAHINMPFLVTWRRTRMLL